MSDKLHSLSLPSKGAISDDNDKLKFVGQLKS